MASEIILRAAEQRDVPALIRLLQRSWLVTWAPELPFEAVQVFAAADPAKSHAENEWRSFVVAMRENLLLGMVQTDRDLITSLHVDPSYWNGGIGSQLLDKAEGKIVLAHGIARLEVRHFNTRARNFYKRHGWIEARQYWGTECGSPVENVEMQKILSTR